VPPIEILIEIGYAAAVGAAVLLVTWPWRERGGPVPVALGLGVATCHAVWRGFPAPWPADATELLFHFALLGAAFGAFGPRLPAPARWASRAVIAGAFAWALFRTVDPPWRIALVACGFLATWSAVEWRATRVEGPGVPAALVVTAGAGALALERGNSAVLAQTAAALAAATGAWALLRPRARDGVAAFTLVALPLWACGARFADLPLESAALLAAAPLAAQRRWWLGALAALAAAGFAAYLSHAANPIDPGLGY
jgi:hypothetical protein